MFYALLAKREAVEAAFNVRAAGGFFPNAKITASSPAPIITNSTPDELSSARFGIEAPWQDERRKFLYNARSETLSTKPSFRELFKSNRCLIPATAFYEWKTTPQGKQPFIFSHPKGVFAFAGLWSKTKQSDGLSGLEFAIIATTPNHKVAQVHDRMPVILEPSQKMDWLEKGMAEILKPAPDDSLSVAPADKELFMQKKFAGKQAKLTEED